MSDNQAITNTAGPDMSEWGYAERILGKLLLDADVNGYCDMDRFGRTVMEGKADLDEEEAGWLQEFKNRVLP